MRVEGLTEMRVEGLKVDLKVEGGGVRDPGVREEAARPGGPVRRQTGCGPARRFGPAKASAASAISPGRVSISSTKSTTHLDHTSHCKTTTGTNWSNRWTNRVFIINTRRDSISVLIALSIRPFSYFCQSVRGSGSGVEG